MSMDEVEEQVQMAKEQQLKEQNKSPVQLVPTKSDADLAAEFKEKVIKAYEPLIEVLNEYDKHGLNMQCSVGKNAFNKYQIVQLAVVKQY